MTVSNEDLQYLPYFDRNRGRIFHKDVKENTKLFISEFRETEFGAKLVSEGLAYGANLDQILEAAQAQFGREEINMTEYLQVAKSLWMLGDLKPKPAPVTPVAAPKELTEPQKRWSEYRQFSERSTSAQCTARAKVDSGYASFMQKNYERELATPVGDAVTPAGTQPTRRTKKVSEEVRHFAELYRTTPTEEIRKQRNALTNPLGWQEFRELEDAAIAANLI
jgi:hypothetical protein